MNWKTILRHLIGVASAWGSLQLGIPPGTEEPVAIASYAITEKILKPLFGLLGE